MENSRFLCSPTGFLLCTENVASLDDKGNEIEGFGSSLDDGYDDEYIRMLVERESSCGGLRLEDYLQEAWIGRARLDAIQYILRKRELLRFRFQTAYASVIYLDKFLSRRSIDGGKSWAMRLLSMACLSVAAKMEEIYVPPLPQFCNKDYDFGGESIQRMELLVLNALEWKLGLISPFAFIQFFASKFFDNSTPRNGVSRIGEIILGTTRDVKIMCHRPSVVAAASTLFALDQGFTRDALELKIGPLASSYSFNIENIISCYYLVREMENERLNMSKGITSPDLSPIQLRRDDELNESCSITSSAKRKRLVFDVNGPFDADDAPDKKGKP